MDRLKTNHRIPVMALLAILAAICCLLSFGAVARFSSTTVAHTLLSITATGPFWSIYEDSDADRRTLVFSESYPALDATYGTLKDYGYNFLGLQASSASDVPWLNSDAVAAATIDYAVFESQISPATSTAYWFCGCTSLKSIGDASSSSFSRLDTASVTDMTCMLSGCESLTYIDLSGISTAAVTSAANAFRATTSLSRITYGATWSFSGATSSRIAGLEPLAAPENATYEGLWVADSGPDKYTTYTEHEIPSNVAAEYTWSIVRALTLDHNNAYG